ncbi:MAG: BspA family leucine-rich repeat surface protein, partial [Proteobacteria bacterium]
MSRWIRIISKFLLLLVLQISCNSELAIFIPASGPAFEIDSSANLISPDSYTLTWNKHLKAKSYDITIAADQGCEESIFQKTGIQDNSVIFDALSDGHYFFCVYAIVSGRRVGASNNGIGLTIDRTDPLVSTPNDAIETKVAFMPGMSIKDDTATTVEWYKVSGPGEVKFSQFNDVNPWISADQSGLYKIKAKITDGAGNFVEKLYQFYWHAGDESSLKFVSLSKAGSAADGYINSAETAGTGNLWTLTQIGANSIAYSNPFLVGNGSVSCDESRTYLNTEIPNAAALSIDGAYALCVRLNDPAGQIVYGQSEVLIRDSVPPALTSLALANSAADGFINVSEKFLVNAIWSLAATGYEKAMFTSALDDTAGGLTCDALSLFNQSTIAAPSSLSIDGTFASCVKLIDAAGNVTFGKSIPVVRDTMIPVITSFNLLNAAADGYINDSEKALSSALWSLTQTGGAAVAFTSPLLDSFGTLTCSDSQSYGMSTIASPADLLSDGIWVICARATSSAGNAAYAKSASLIRDIAQPIFTHLNNTGVGSDGYVNDTEKTSTAALWTLSASGYANVHYTSALSDTGGTLTCDATNSYTSTTIPSASTLSSDGPYASCVRLVDAAGNISFGKSAQVIRDIIGPTVTAFAKANDAADGFISNTETSSTQVLWTLTQTGASTTFYSALVNDTAGAAVCDSSKTYDQTTIPRAVDLSVDGHYSLCVKLTDGIGNITYDKADQVVRGTSGPTFGALNGANAASDGFINDGEKSASTALWTLTQLGSVSTTYSAILDNSGTPVVCDNSQTYGQSSIPIVTDLSGDGSWVICVKLVDAAASVNYGKSSTIVRDTVMPTFTSLVGTNAATDGYINDAEKALTTSLWALTQSGGTNLKYSTPVDDTISVTCDSAKTYSLNAIPTPVDLSSDKPWIICARVTDAAGNIVYGKSSQVVRDIVYPVFTSLVKANAATDGYINDSEKLLVSAMWTLTATGYSNASFTTALSDNSLNLVCDALQTYGQTSIADPSTLSSDGIYTLCTKISDAAGNGSFGKSQSITRDVAAPVFSSLARANEAADGYISNAEKTSTLAIFTLTASGYSSAQYTVASDDTSNGLICDSSRSYSQSTVGTIADAAADGTYAMCVVLGDAAGNIVYGKSSQVIRDTSMPVFTSLALANAATDGYINDSEKGLGTALWALTASNYTVAAYTVVASDAGPVLTCTSSNTYNQSSIPVPTSLLADGYYSVCVKLSNAAGNVVYGKAVQLERDVAVPVLSSLAKANVASDGYVSEAEKNSATALYALTATGYSSVDYTAALSDGTGTLNCSTGQTFGSSSIALTSALVTDGTYVVCVRLKDAAQNTVYGKSDAVIRDIVTPTVTINTLSTADLTPPLTGTVNDNVATIAISVNNHNYYATNNGNGTWTLADNSLYLIGNGIYDVSATATDNAGNASSDSTTDELTITTPAFTTSWKTDNAGSSDGSSIHLPLVSSGTYNFVVQWGDGRDDIITAWNAPAATHTYTTPGTYTVKINGTINGFAFKGAGDALKILTVSQWAQLKLGNGGEYFRGAGNLTISAVDIPDLSGTTNFTRIFGNCISLASIPNLGSWDVSSVQIFKGAFDGATVFNGAVGGWVTTAATDMSEMFRQNNLFNQALGTWDVSHVTDFGSMFSEAHAFNQPLNSWTTTSATKMGGMFYYALAFNQPLNLWDVSHVTAMNNMFQATPFNQDITGWNVSQVQDFARMFTANAVFNQAIGSWTTSSATNMLGMFQQATAFNQSLNSWNVSSVTEMGLMFKDATTFNGAIGNWNVASVRSLSNTFEGATAFNQPIGAWIFTDLRNLNSTFNFATSFNQNLNSWDVSKVTQMGFTFAHATAFNGVISDWNTSSVVSTSDMFSWATSFNQPLGNWNMGNVVNMNSMFYRATSFNQPLNLWNVSKAEWMHFVFREAFSFNGDITSWNTSSAKGMNGTFYAATSFNQDISGW